MKLDQLELYPTILYQISKKLFALLKVGQQTSIRTELHPNENFT